MAPVMAWLCGVSLAVSPHADVGAHVQVRQGGSVLLETEMAAARPTGEPAQVSAVPLRIQLPAKGPESRPWWLEYFCSGVHVGELDGFHVRPLRPLAE